MITGCNRKNVNQENKNILENKNRLNQDAVPMIKLDHKDHKIIAQLRRNSRIAIRDLAKATNLRPSTVHDRIKKLVRDKVIEEFTLKLNDKALGENFVVFMFVSGSLTEYVTEKLLKNKNIKDVYGITGEYDMFFKLKFSDVVEFNDFLIQFRKQNRDVTKTLTMIATIKLKEEV